MPGINHLLPGLLAARIAPDPAPQGGRDRPPSGPGAILSMSRNSTAKPEAT